MKRRGRGCLGFSGRLGNSRSSGVWIDETWVLSVAFGCIKGVLMSMPEMEYQMPVTSCFARFVCFVTSCLSSRQAEPFIVLEA
jgi:hypothetical protein